ncbi:MAG TPA: SGNH/GDSL hydrolase family protein [Polyangiaceae bacterium]|nr:SGNH/GDSL hydrolase family protein [Polyangiaceae bacterium]
MDARIPGSSRSVILLALGLALACAREEGSPAASGGAAGAEVAELGGAASGGVAAGGDAGSNASQGGTVTGGTATGGTVTGGTVTGGDAGSNAFQGGAATGGAASSGEAGSDASQGGEAGSNASQGGAPVSAGAAGRPQGAGGGAAGAAGGGAGSGAAAAGGAAGASGGDCLDAVPPEEPVALPTDGSLDYLALGDSYTIGESVDAERRWPVQLAGLLQEAGLDVAEPEIIARTGWTTSELDAAIDARDPEGPYALVSLLIGVNDQYRGYDVEGYEPEFRAMLERAVGFAGGAPERVLVLSIPDWGVTPFASGRDRAAIAAEIDAFNAVNARVTAELGAHYVDVTAASRSDGPDLVASDGLHPSARQYAIWACLARPAAEAALTP